MVEYYYSDGTILPNRIKDKLLHRLDGPAVDWGDGDYEWYKNGKRHRLDGPAVERFNGEKYWFINGKQFTKEEFERYILVIKLSGLLHV